MTKTQQEEISKNSAVFQKIFHFAFAFGQKGETTKLKLFMFLDELFNALPENMASFVNMCPWNVAFSFVFLHPECSHQA